MKVFRYLPLAVALLFISGLFYWALFMPKPEIGQRIYDTIKQQEKEADLLFKQVIFEEVSDGRKYWQLAAETAMVNNNQGVASLQKVDGTFFKNGKAVLKFRSPAAVWDMKRKEIYLDNPIGYDVSLQGKIADLVKSLRKDPLSVFNLPRTYQKGAGYWFQARNLSWKLADQQLVCTGGIVLNKGEVTGHAERLEGDVGLEKIILKGKPYIVVQSPNTFPITVEAEAFEVRSAQDAFLAHGNPRIRWEAARVEAEQAGYFQSQKKLDLSGNVKLNYNDIYASGDSAAYFTQTQLVWLQGKARAEQGDNRLTGDKIAVSLKEKKISLMGKSKVVVTKEEMKR